MSNKIDHLLLYLDENNYDVVCISEHWLTEPVLKLINLNTYYLASYFCRSTLVHGGVSIFLKKNFKLKCINLDPFNIEQNAEFCGIELLHARTIIINVYRSGKGNFDTFLDRLEGVLRICYNFNKKTVILGDFNVEFKENSANLRNLLNLLESYGFNPTISDYTRVTSTSKSCIDNILTNLNKENFEAGVVDPCLSDHKGQYVNLFNTTNCSNKSSWKRVITSRGLEQMRISLSMINWYNSFSEVFDINCTANSLINIFEDHVHRHFPLKKINTSMTKPPVCWFNDDLRRLRDNIACIKQIYDASKEENVLNIYKALKKQYKSEILKSKKTAYDNYIINSNNVMRDSWRIINNERNNIHRTQDIPFTPDIMNNFFVNIVSDLISALPKTRNNALNMLHAVATPNTTFILELTNAEEVGNVIMSLKNSSCLDVYNLNSKIINNVVDLVSLPLSLLINACFRSGKFPDAFKVNKVIPIFKKGDPDNMNNYRPISIIPIFAKIFEIILKSRIVAYFEDNDLLNPAQFGFRRKRSTTQAILDIVNQLVSNLEEGKTSVLTLCDLTKAFDCVPHSILVEKLSFYGIKGVPLNLLVSYLENRKQCVSINNNTSGIREVTHGVPQGSVLGPLLFIIFINDLYYYMLPNKCVLFADDTTLISAAKNMDSLLKLSEAVEKESVRWFCANNLLLNPDKTQRLTISSNSNISKGGHAKLLGVVLDDNLNWSCHIDFLNKKLTSYIFLFRRLKSFISNDMLRVSYFALFHSHASYAIILWGNSPHAIRIFRQQKQIIRILANIGYRDHCRPYFILYSIMTLPSLYILATLLEVHKSKFLYNTNTDVHDHNTRTRELLRIPRYRLAKSEKNSINLKLYNHLPNTIKMLPINQFKRKVKNYLLAQGCYSVEEFLGSPVNV